VGTVLGLVGWRVGRRGQRTRQAGGRGAHPPAARATVATPDACFVAASRHQDPETYQTDFSLPTVAVAAHLASDAPGLVC
jgi:hypothetical protein